ncbi:MAG TPA: putative glycoside hydrolase [Candidatus Magasanikbacteria bacterium]|nr:putative glycoside hydrolase [Candidatus Magasanikbacteria bacterium]
MKMNKKILILSIFILVFFTQIFFVERVSSATNNFPRRANYFLKWQISEAEVRELARYDLLVLDMEIQARQPEVLRKLRVLNRDIIILAYITAQEIRTDARGGWSIMRDRLVSLMNDGMYLHASRGGHLSWWNGTELLNVTNISPSGVLCWNEYLPNFVATEILATKLWDGVFFDNAWDSITHFAGADIDLDGDGSPNNNLDASWREGMRRIYTETRRLSNNKYIIVANGNTREYTEELNGKMIENFLPIGWQNTMNTYVANFNTTFRPQINIINANTGNSGKSDDYRRMRFGLASALLSDGYYSFDHGDTDHGQTWWYDEYNVDLGKPLRATAVAAEGGQTTAQYVPGVWRRDFENGLAVVNSGDESEVVNLGKDYEKINGTQDKSVNDGAIVSELELSADDGVVLLKTISSLQDVIFRNGDFVRFYRSDGSRARNGFYVFAEKYRGGDFIGYVDMNGDGERETIVASRNKITIWRSNGRLYAKIYPYTGNYTGTLRIAVGDLNGDSRAEIYVAPSAGRAGALKVFSIYGETIREDWYPKGEKYRGGMSIAVARQSNGEKFLVVGAGENSESRVSIFDSEYNLINEWLAFDKKFVGGINVAVGNIDGVGNDEVVVSAGRGLAPIVKIFSLDGEKLMGEFRPGAVTPDGLNVLDVDFDGRAEILTSGNGF